MDVILLTRLDSITRVWSVPCVNHLVGTCPFCHTHATLVNPYTISCCLVTSCMFIFTKKMGKKKHHIFGLVITRASNWWFDIKLQCPNAMPLIVKSFTCELLGTFQQRQLLIERSSPRGSSLRAI